MTAGKYFLWFRMLSKRLLVRWSFCVILLSIPLAVWGMQCIMSGESGILTIFLCGSKDNTSACEVMDYIKNSKSSLLFKKSFSLKESLRSLNAGEADAVWYFDDDFNKKAEDYASGKNTVPVVKVFEREDTTPLKLSREKLFSGINKRISYSVCRNFLYDEFFDKDEITEEKIREYIKSRDNKKDIVTVRTQQGKAVTAADEYLVMPVRGILSLIVMVGGMSSAIVFTDDRKKGRFCRVSFKNHIIPAFAQCLAGTAMSALAAFVALRFSGLWLGFLKECFAMLLFVVASTGFCLNLCAIFNSPLKLASFVPLITVLMLVLSPIFFDVPAFRHIKLLLPTYYYLNCLTDIKYVLKFLCYIPCGYLCSYVLFQKKNFTPFVSR